MPEAEEHIEGAGMRIWRIPTKQSQVKLAGEQLDVAVECARSLGEIPFSQVMEISEVREK